MRTQLILKRLGRTLGAVSVFAVGAISPAATQTPSGQSTRDYFEPALDDGGQLLSTLRRVEITLLSRSEFLGIRVIQMTKLGADKPDGFGLDVPRPMSLGDTASGLYCYISTKSGSAFKLAYNSDLTTPLEPIDGEAKAAMRDFAAEIEAVTKDLTPDRIGFGIARKFPVSAFAAVDRVLKIAGGCNWPAMTLVPGPTAKGDAATGLSVKQVP